MRIIILALLSISFGICENHQKNLFAHSDNRLSFDLGMTSRNWYSGSSGNFDQMGFQIDPILSTDNVEINAPGTFSVQVASNSAINDLTIGGDDSFPTLMIQPGVILVVHGNLELLSGSISIGSGGHLVILGPQLIVNGSSPVMIDISAGASLITTLLSVIEVNPRSRATTPKLTISGSGSLALGASLVIGASLDINVGVVLDARTSANAFGNAMVNFGASVSLRASVSLNVGIVIKSSLLFTSPSNSLNVSSATFKSGSSMTTPAVGNSSSILRVAGDLNIEGRVTLSIGLNVGVAVGTNITIASFGGKLNGMFSLASSAGFSLGVSGNLIIATRIPLLPAIDLGIGANVSAGVGVNAGLNL